ncbi:MAG TPA: hypothetical protein VG479_10325 [Gaiellaceae bacterium]|jgi:hypothetical protein|nr:hypothetical protein [Gaiellaceae bacterium]
MIDEASLDRLVRSDARIGPFRASAEGTFLKSCVRPLLCGDLSRFGDEWPLPVAVPPSVEHEHLLELVGPAGLRLLELSSLDELRCEFPEGMRSMQRAWISSHPLGALRSLLDAATGRALRRLANGADLVLIETPRPESVLRALEAMVPEARRMFIELKPTLAPRAGLERAWRAAIDWRPPPISEFVVTAAVANGVTSPRPEEGLRTTTSDSSLSNRMRSRLRPDLVLRVPPVAHDRMQELLRARLLDFLSRKYRPRWELAGTTPDKALVC